MPLYENRSGLNFSSIQEEKMDKIISRKDAIGIYCVGNGLGRIEGFDNYYRPGMTYREFIDKLIKKGLLTQKR
jgi:hypothetical protein